MLQNGTLSDIIIPSGFDILKKQLLEFVPLEKIIICENSKCPVFKSDSWLVTLGYSFLLNISSIKCEKALNIHFGSLPENRGSDPVFRTISQGKKLAYVAIHEIDSKFDSGDLFIERSLEIVPGETYGMLNTRLSHFAVNIWNLIVDNFPEPRKQELQKAQYFKNPTEDELTINWSIMTSYEIENLVNACNPKYGGANSLLNGVSVKIIEVSPVSDNKSTSTVGGIIQFENIEGCFVSCNDDKLLKINIISINEGIISGSKLLKLGLPDGSHFH
jgi:methionyl-tRNA formyltransferase